jgi:PIN domain nuclease of toxin-antitoxin system
MNYLLDTHTFIWFVQDEPELSPRAKELIESPDTECFLSLASIWEISIKVSTGKLNLQEPLGEFLREQLVLNVIDVLPITFEHVTKVRELPFHHRDPFDRLIIAQSILENLPVIGKDEWFDRYGLTRYW